MARHDSFHLESLQQGLAAIFQDQDMDSQDSDNEDERTIARTQELKSRPYQDELLDKAKEGNIIVYLGTGSGKTYIAIMLIKDMRAQLTSGRKAVFLVNSVPLVDQQADAIRQMTGLSVGSYCGADGVDAWDEDKWRMETGQHQVLVLVHQVFYDLLTHSFFQLSDTALIVMDECHHAQSLKDHPYTKIMTDWYHQLKRTDPTKVPKILGLTACLMVKSVTVEKFHQEKNILENILDSKVETATDLLEILQHVTNPDEFKVSYDNDNLTSQQEEIRAVCNETVHNLSNIYQQEKASIEVSEQSLHSKNTAKTDLEKHFKAMKNDILGNLSKSVQHLGLAAFKLKFRSKLSEFTSLDDRAVNAHYNISAKNEMSAVMNTCFTALSSIYNSINLDTASLSSLESLCSKKVLKLLQIMRNFPDSRTLVFVDEKFTSETLCAIIKQFTHVDPSLAHFKVDFAVSPGAKVNPKEMDPEKRRLVIQMADEERRKLKTTLANFRSGATNILVSTSVVEEGLDVRSCNLVIKFDFPSTFRSYVQSKGRARARPSKYILMIAESEAQKWGKKYKDYLAMEQLSLRECHYRDPEADDVFDVEFDEPYMADPDDPESARISGSQAVRLIHKYVQRIKVDRFTRLSVVWQTRPVVGTTQDNLFAGLGNAANSGYETICYMPHKTPFTAPIKGAVRPGKKASKHSTALVVCEMLHHFGELDARLKVKKRQFDLEDDSEDDEDDDGYNPNNRKVGTKKRRQFYQVDYPDQLRIDLRSSREFCLYTVIFNLEKKNDSYKYKHYFPDQDSHSLGLVTSKKLPDFAPINIFHPGGQYQATVQSVKIISLNEDDIDLIRNFQRYILETVWKIDGVHESVGDVLLVSVRKEDMNIDKTVLMEAVNNNQDSKAKKCHLDNYGLSSENVIYPSYKEKKEHYFVEEFVPKEVMSVNSVMPESKKTFKDYYQETYGLKPHDDQNLIRPSFADKQSFMLLPGSQGTASKASNKDVYKTTFFVSEFMRAEPISAGLWRQLQMVPFVLHRMATMTNARNFLTSISIESKSALDVEKRTKVNQSLPSFLMKMDQRSQDPLSIGDIVQAVTLKGANDRFDMERLEILGDCFLKYYTGVFLYYKLLAQDTVNTEEGDLTNKRSKVVGNRNLCKIAQNHQLYKCIVPCQVDVRNTWHPPGFNSILLECKLIDLDKKFVERLSKDRQKTISVGGLLNWISEGEMSLALTNPEDLLNRAVDRCEKNEETPGVKLRSHKLIGDKSLADCVEALIGAFMVSSGQQGALSFMSKIGINLSSSNSVEDLLNRVAGDGVVESFEPQQDAFIDDQTRLTDADRAAILYGKLGLEEIERIVGYTFKEKSFLLQAFTHASYCENRLTRSYERLEFIGDAVLDYLVTIYIYSHLGPHTGPGRITDIRSALVCNNMFASVLVSHGLHHFILMQSPMLFNMIQSYVEDRSKDLMKVDTNLKLINETEPPELEYVEVPKVLGDVLESLMGAIYIDSGHDLETVWRIFRRLVPQLEEVIQNPPMNAKKELMERCPGKVKFESEPHKADKDFVAVVAHVKDKKFRGFGKNKRSAEIAASKLALRCI